MDGSTIPIQAKNRGTFRAKARQIGCFPLTGKTRLFKANMLILRLTPMTIASASPAKAASGGTMPGGSVVQAPQNNRRLANAIRALSMDAVEAAKSGHPGMPMGMADVATVLFTRFLKFDPTAPAWPDRDRFVLSAGHGSMLLYALLYLTGYEAMTIDQIKRFRQLGSITEGHPEICPSLGIDTETAP